MVEYSPLFTAPGSSSPIRARICLAVIGNKQDSINYVTLVYGDLFPVYLDGPYSASERRTHIVSQMRSIHLSVNKVQIYIKIRRNQIWHE